MQRNTATDMNLPYLLYQPEKVAEREDWPLLVFLHGSGERGTDLTLVEKHGAPRFLSEGLEIPALVYAPQCPLEQRWDDVAAAVFQDLETLLPRLPLNANRVYLSGFSMGGQGTWALAFRQPERFAALVPVAGRAPDDPEFMPRLCTLAELPVWVFHGAADQAVEVACSDRVVARLRDCGAAELHYTRYADADHGQTSNRAFSNPDLYDWLWQWGAD